MVLSAIAARRAAQAGALPSEAPVQVVPPEEPTSRTSLSPSPPPFDAKPTKRKKAGNGEPTSRKRKRNTAGPERSASKRYFASEVTTPKQPEHAKSRPVKAFSPSVPVQEFEDQDEDVEMEEPEDVAAPQEEPQVVLTNFRPVPEENFFQLLPQELTTIPITASSAPSIALILRPEASLSFLGTVRLIVLKGEISLHGVTVKSSLQSHDVFSPRSSPISTIFVPSFESSSTVAQLPKRLEKHCGKQDTIIVLQELRTGVEGLGRVVRVFDGIFESEEEEDGMIDLGVEGFHLLTQDERGLHPFVLPPTWAAACDSVMGRAEDDEDSEASPTVTLVKGPKSVGKSTFSRLLLNRLTTQYRKVAYLDCDIGQPEFTAAGMVSLHVLSQPIFGPPFTHPRLPYRAHFVGGTTPRSHPSRFLSCITALLQTFRFDLQYSTENTDEGNDDERISHIVPLVINTHGWVKGLGGDLLRTIEEIAEPTHVFEFEPRPVSGDGVLPRASYQTPTYSTNSLLLEAAPSSGLSKNYTAADYRAISMLSYFHAQFSAGSSIPRRWNTDIPLCAQPPWEVDCTVAIDSISLLGAGAEDVVPEEIHRVLNCAVVALIALEDAPSSDVKVSSGLPYVQGGPAHSPQSSHCVGLGLIRAIQSSTVLQLLTPIPTSALVATRALVKGELELPIWGWLDYRDEEDKGVCEIEWGRVPYLQYGGHLGKDKGVQGAGKKRVRRNLMRRGQM